MQFSTASYGWNNLEPQTSFFCIGDKACMQVVSQKAAK